VYCQVGGEWKGKGKTGERVDEKGQKVVGRENNGLQYRRRRESEEDENVDNIIVMMQLIIQG
jgi:hypothetical protein